MKGMMIRLLVATLTTAFIGSTVATADPVPIVGYDVEETPLSCSGRWFHTYTGTIANTGQSVSWLFDCTDEGNPALIANYSGGEGTLNDGEIATSELNTHLFATTDGIGPAITLHFAQKVTINEIRLFGGDFVHNIFPGALNGATVEIAGTSVALASIPFGLPGAIGPVNDLLDLTTTALANIPTDKVVLSNFRTILPGFGFGFDGFSITEITIDGTPASRAGLWIGLKNSDDVGLRVDLLAEVFLKVGTTETKVAQGQLNNQSSGSSGFGNAILKTIGLTQLVEAVPASAGSELKFTVSVRRTCSGGGHNSGTVRLWYNGRKIDSGSARDAGSRFEAAIGPDPRDYFLLGDSMLGISAGLSRRFIDRSVNSREPCPSRSFTPFGTWSTTLSEPS